MRPFVIGGDMWRVVRVAPGDPRLIDRTATPRIATTDPRTATIYIADWVAPPLLDRVVMHEVAHAVTISHGLLGPLYRVLPDDVRVMVEEWSAGLVENYSMEVAAAASEALGRPVCVRGFCNGGS